MLSASLNKTFLSLSLSFVAVSTGEKRKVEEGIFHEEIKRKKVEGDVLADLVSEIVSTMTVLDPSAMVGPEVKHFVTFLSHCRRDISSISWSG